jgi:GH15 family glucan-1,4-alpha-glucosidase
MPAQRLDLAVIGNGRTAALLNTQARLVWWCYPRFDGDPVFCRLISGDEEKGFSDVVLDGFSHSESEYERNTAIVRTTLTSSDGSALRITDFAPRYHNFSASRARRSWCAYWNRCPAFRASPCGSGRRRIMAL